MNELRAHVPTYNGEIFQDQIQKQGLPELGEPMVPLVIRVADGFSIVFGTHDYDDINKPDIHIERHPHGWVIFLHPAGAGDASGSVYFADDGRCFLVKEFAPAPGFEIEVRESDEGLPWIDERSEQ